MSDDLHVEMDRDAKALGAPVQIVREIFFGDLLYRHAEPQRSYHNHNHLVALAELLNEHAPHIQPGSPPRLAIWWHDAIYDPQAKDNEERSADLAREHLARLGAAPSVIDETARIILMTKNHWSGGSAGDGDYFLDADIAILGAPPEAYDWYADQVREEYAWAPDDAYRSGRSAFLNAAISRERLFRTDAFAAAYAAQARENMQRELTRLAA
jgi:predicted metal-dependent HD superfamily phosphohydrolase